MAKKDVSEILRKYREGTISPEEKAMVDAWYQRLGQSPAEDEIELHDAMRDIHWTRIRTALPRPQKRSGAGQRYLLIGVAAAALCVAVALIYAVKMPGTNQEMVLTEAVETDTQRSVTSQHTQLETIMLPDGSRVTLQPHSTLTYTDNFQNERHVTLKGEAFFDVVKDPAHPFLVYSGAVTTKVLGTSFTIQAYEEATDVTVEVTSGTVSVVTPARNRSEVSGEESILKPNQKVVYDKVNHTAQVSLVNEPLPLLSDTPGVPLLFEDKPATEIFHALEMHYGVTIDFDEAAFSGCVLTTSIGEENIYRRLDVICKALGATYSTQGTTILIAGKGCQP